VLLLFLCFAVWVFFAYHGVSILIAKITINTYENNNTTLIFESDNGQNINTYNYFKPEI
jgi:hypothetical protein